MCEEKLTRFCPCSIRLFCFLSILFLVFVGVPPTLANAETVPVPTLEPTSPSGVADQLKALNRPFYYITSTYVDENGVNLISCVAFVSNDVNSKYIITDNVVSCSDSQTKYVFISNTDTPDIFRSQLQSIDILMPSFSNYGRVYENYMFANNPYVYDYDYIDTGVYYYNPNGADLGHNDLVNEADKSLIDMKVNTMRIIKPTSNATLDKDNNTIFADEDYFDFEVQIKIAIPTDITMTSHSRSPLWGSKDIDQFVKRNITTFKESMTVTFPNALMAKTENVTTLGSVRDWIDKHYCIFVCKGRITLDTNPSALTDTKLILGCNAISDFYSITSATYIWVNDAVTMNLAYHKDIDGNGIDDVSGDVIPKDSVVDTDGDGRIDDTKEGADSFFERFTDDIKKVPEYSDDVGDLYDKIFGLFPPPIPQLITTGICVIIFVSVVGFIRG